jgi:uncharacterized Zn finger protein (UPF0148 family)
MILRSEYHWTCAACATPVVTQTQTGACPKCGAEYEIQWQAPYRAPQKEKTAHETR